MTENEQSASLLSWPTEYEKNASVEGLVKQS
jgi:hypothetical protein